MKNIKTIIEVIDEELYKKSKQYLTLGQANKLLVNKSIITVKEKHDQSLKKLLETRKIKNSYQTHEKPRQWRITMSKNGEKKRNRKYEKFDSNQPNLNHVNSEAQFTGLTDKQKGWGIGIIVFIALFVYVNYFSENTDETYITQSNNFASYNEENIDLAIKYSVNNDTQSFLNLTMNGQIFELDAGQEVYVTKVKFDKVKIRFKGSSREVWVLSKAIKYK